MRIINKVDIAACRQWIRELTKQAVQASGIVCNRIVIDGYEYGERIFFKANGQEYTIRIWDWNPLQYDNKGHACRAFITYTLFLDVEDDDGGSHGEEVEDSALMIKWKD